jgi:hypothetical protein
LISGTLPRLRLDRDVHFLPANFLPLRGRHAAFPWLFPFQFPSVAAGLAISFVVTRFIATLLYGVKPFDALTFGAMSLLLLAVAFAASVAPAYRAAQTDPMTILRTQ